MIVFTLVLFMAFYNCAEELQTYFEQYGKVVEVVLKTDQQTGLPRGFGFVGFADAASVDKVTVCIIFLDFVQKEFFIQIKIRWDIFLK